ncbi:hypothetical protein DPM18_08165 [Polynucleobacter paneuropaeus]|jgi:hypothetical protein|uniref:hypothetical protein n=1 Tax=Polynucleobacter paneuropaeus TaxID=2527775 RepID=UPI000DBF270A|nr:hypothetical protein [Polynucleobacter paneuropaeus]AWW46786.1 hypothetical protein DPM18_08165 [Polynucleobacter paneuropaeus]
MKLFFKPVLSGISKFLISPSHSSDYEMEISLNFCKFYLDDSLKSQQEFIKSYLGKILNTEISSLCVKTGVENSCIEFGKSYIGLQLTMNEFKFFKLYDQLNKNMKSDKIIRIELREKELEDFPSREGIEDNLRVPINFEKYSIEFTYE